MLWKSSDSTPAELGIDDSGTDDRQIMSNNWMREGNIYLISISKTTDYLSDAIVTSIFSYVLIYLSLGLDSSTMYILKFSGGNEAPVAKAKDLTIILLASVVFLDGSEWSDDEGIIPSL
ncbi:unnamed protein product [Brugia pahangi]|uniref:PGG domain-containing protein n=1 Tax=Brugia pahangi TaxID=6280 RepID=A0A0N4TIM7_BRUPA|nr:unnamed protein product [Brugia pahangi]